MADAQISQLVVRSVSALDPAARISRLVVRTLSPYPTVPGRVAQESVRTLSALVPILRLSRLTVRTLSPFVLPPSCVHACLLVDPSPIAGGGQGCKLAGTLSGPAVECA